MPRMVARRVTWWTGKRAITPDLVSVMDLLV
jgi:hypothetical protein